MKKCSCKKLAKARYEYFTYDKVVFWLNIQKLYWHQRSTLTLGRRPAGTPWPWYRWKWVGKKYTWRLNFRKCFNPNKLLNSVEHIETREDSDVSLRRRRRSSRDEDGGGGGGHGERPETAKVIWSSFEESLICKNIIWDAGAMATLRDLYGCIEYSAVGWWMRWNGWYWILPWELCYSICGANNQKQNAQLMFRWVLTEPAASTGVWGGVPRSVLSPGLGNTLFEMCCFFLGIVP